MAKGGFQGFPGGRGGFNMNALKQMQKMQEDLMKMQAELEEQTFTASAGGGAVTATVNGRHELVALDIAPEAVDPEDVEMLCDMVMAAVNEAMRAADAKMAESMSKLTGGLNLPF